MAHKQEKYDLIFSLGGSCAASKNLRRQHLQILSFPFDWVYHTDKNHIDAIINTFKTDFTNWLALDHLKPFTREERAGKGHLLYIDDQTEFRFIHDFDVEPSKNKAHYLNVYNKYQRRIKRLLTLIQKSQKVLLVVDLEYQPDYDKLNQLIILLEQKFSDTKFNILVQRYLSNSDREGLEVISEKIKVNHVFRGRDNADFETSSMAWKYLRKFDLTFYGKNILQKQLLENIVFLSRKNKAFCFYFLKGFLPNIVRLKLRVTGIKFDFSFGELKD